MYGRDGAGRKHRMWAHKVCFAPVGAQEHSLLMPHFLPVFPAEEEISSKNQTNSYHLELFG